MISRTKLPSVQFTTGLLIKRYGISFGGWVPRDMYTFLVIGTIAEIQLPFLLEYTEGVAQWESPTRLDLPLRRKILALLRTTCRFVEQPPSFIQVHDLREFDHADRKQAEEQASSLRMAFEQRYRSEFLNETPEEFLVLNVPFAEKDEAKKLGAVWDSSLRKWKVNKELGLKAFERWLNT